MYEPTKRQFTLELSDGDAREFCEKCYKDGTSPEEVLQGFISDLIDGAGTRGSDERELASAYYNRCLCAGTRCTFSQWILNYCTYSIDEIVQRLEDLQGLKDTLQELADNPEEIAAKNEIEDIQAEIRDREAEITEIYEEYAESEAEPETLEEGIKGVKACYEGIENTMKGGFV